MQIKKLLIVTMKIPKQKAIPYYFNLPYINRILSMFCPFFCVQPFGKAEQQ